MKPLPYEDEVEEDKPEAVIRAARTKQNKKPSMNLFNISCSRQPDKKHQAKDEHQDVAGEWQLLLINQ